MKTERVVYYSDPLHDDFAGTNINTCTLGEDFPLIRRGPVWRFLAFVVYYIIAMPLVWLMSKLILGLKFENRRALRQLRGTGFFLYGNHTQLLDAYIPPLAAFPKLTAVDPAARRKRFWKRLSWTLVCLLVIGGAAWCIATGKCCRKAAEPAPTEEVAEAEPAAEAPAAELSEE